MHMLLLAISTLALILIAVTMAFRAVELKEKGLRWNVRRIGLVLAAFAPLGILVGDWARHSWPDIYQTCFRVGLLFVFMTTPNMPPWHRWVWKGLHPETVQ